MPYRDKKTGESQFHRTERLTAWSERAAQTCSVLPVKRNAVMRGTAGTPERRSTAVRHDALRTERSRRGVRAHDAGH